MKKTNEPCSCRACPKTMTCNWTCDELSAWAEDKSFARVADEFIGAYNDAARKKRMAQRKHA